MLKVLFFPLVFTILSSITVFAQAPVGYQITGYIKGLQEGEEVHATYLNDFNQKRADGKDSAYVKNGVFHLSGFVPGGPRDYVIGFTRKGFKGYDDVYACKYFHLIINNGDNIILRSDTDISKLGDCRIDEYIQREGGKSDLSLRALMSAWFFYSRAIRNLKEYAVRIVDSVGFDGPLLTGVYDCVDQVNRSFYTDVFTDNPNQLAQELSMAHLILTEGVYRISGHAAFLADRYSKLSKEEKNSFYGQALTDLSKLCVGQRFIDFTLPTPDGKSLNSKDIIGKSKVTLIHFWTSNSQEKKKWQDEVRAFYKKYHDRGFNVIAIYAGKGVDEWKNDLKKDDYPWYNVADLQGVEGPCLKTYHEPGPLHEFSSLEPNNTTNVLIDQRGKIISWDTRGLELRWNLWKYFGN